MQEKKKGQKDNHTAKRRLILLVTVVAAIILLALIVATIMQPERSVASYCKVYKEENSRLANVQGDTYGVAVFSHKSSNPADFASAFSRLERVAPDEIQPDVRALKQVFEKIDSDPSQSLSASLSGLGAESSVKEWTDSHCRN